MTPQRWPLARKLFDAAVKLGPAEADAYLRAECGDDAELLSEVRAMLEEHRRTGALDRPAWDFTPASPPSVPSGAAPVFGPGQVVAGRYTIVRYLSRGGMGEVYEAEHPLLPDHVALKTLLPAIASDEAMIARFKQEIQLARKIAHPNVCKVFDLEWHPAEGSTILFLTMEFLPGETLAARIQREGRLRPAEALPLLQQMADALDAAHRSGVIHRDFKTSNVMLVPGAAGIRAVVTDFGLARGVTTAAETTATLTNNVAGTLDYMAPELMNGSVATFRSDIYALGAVAYKTITGSLPFAGEAPLAAAFLRARKPIPSPRTLVPDLDPKWEHAILRALDPEPGRRFSDVREFPRALRGEPVSVTVALPTLTRRKVVAAVCVVAALAAAGIGWRTWSRSRTQPGPEAARLYQQGVDDIHAGAYFAATKALDQAVQLAPAFAPARARFAESWVELDLPEKALREFLPIRRQDTSSLSTLDQLQIEAVDRTITREFPAAVEKYEQMRKVTPSAELDIDLGRIYEKAGKPDNAIEAYRRGAEGPSHSPAAWLRLGVLYAQRKKLTESDAAFAEAERRYQQSSNLEGITELTLQRGVAANRASRFPEAAALLRKAMEHAHDAGNLQQEISAKLTLANVSYKAGDTDLAETLAREALATAQTNQLESLTIRGLINLGTSQIGKGDLKGAEQRLQDALALALRTNSTKFVAQTQLNLASLHDTLHRSDDQIREANQALAYFQPNRWVQETFSGLTLLGRAELYRGNFAAAIPPFQRLFDEASKAGDSPNMARAQEALGNAFADSEMYPQALENYREFLRLSADDPQLNSYAALDCALTLSRLGRAQEALPELARAEAAKLTRLRISIPRARAEMALMLNNWREARDRARSTLAEGNVNPPAILDLTRILGLALLRSGDRKAGLQKCEEALALANKLNDVGSLVDTRLALIEALLANRDSARTLAVFHELEPLLASHPETRWRAYGLMSHADPQYAGRAKEAFTQLDSLWGHDAFLRYLSRPDFQELTRPFLQPIPAKHP
uniref:Serine/threonine protein kinase with TPR repeats n=1 Tax=Solibacter usitatus (strain Ellin6076) TaxID=234267 RepID=Q01QI7_SOLUE